MAVDWVGWKVGWMAVCCVEKMAAPRVGSTVGWTAGSVAARTAG